MELTAGPGRVDGMLQEVAAYLVAGPLVTVLAGGTMVVVLLLRHRARVRKRPPT
jgi:hypothetical protein